MCLCYYGLPFITVGYQVYVCALPSVTVDYGGLLPWITRGDINVCLQQWIWAGNIDNVVWVTVDSGANSV